MSIDYLVRGMTTSSLFGKPTSGVLRGSGPCSGLSSAHGVASNVPTRAYMRHVLLYGRSSKNDNESAARRALRCASGGPQRHMWRPGCRDSSRHRSLWLTGSVVEHVVSGSIHQPIQLAITSGPRCLRLVPSPSSPQLRRFGTVEVDVHPGSESQRQRLPLRACPPSRQIATSAGRSSPCVTCTCTRADSKAVTIVGQGSQSRARGASIHLRRGRELALTAAQGRFDWLPRFI